ncbi:16S rRNA (uracil(1498)-N(3))-methyltransferase [Endozoicomonas sp. SCSIO W0465]|uniref:16S rRNA (uracil(1498)-N(3))-methyltransferase n=1 Tax=Endozoicomonas sp. SCSIO W0465 TaxID=2918516 RepID=UPI002074AD13|nr:16S rRNA (uracil(1498)-N(3))-methyltransferase [Endozoicomonas sp. SCSIO W0465]USE35335.1 16S rRNA (uracil(1498)-N(3))-methyltransferase [Endozoicomonas sp. SCSIO W0465]
MNLLLLEQQHFIDEQHAELDQRQIKHVLGVHQASEGDELRVGMVNGKIGKGVITQLSSEKMQLEVELDSPPPQALPLTVLLALPRPKMLKRSLQHLTSLGVKKIILMNSYRVEKSFWQSPWLSPTKVREQLILGLEQARDTVMPEVIVERRFKPFVEDRLPALVQGRRGLVAHPVGGEGCPHQIAEPAVLAIGPEGGFIEYEVDKLEQAGFQRIHLGPRILRVETAVTAIVSKLYD